MSILWRGQSSRTFGGITAETLLADRRSLRTSRSAPYVTGDTAMRASAVWAILRMRCDMVSTTPLCVYRKVAGMQVEANPTPFLLDPGGDGRGIEDWLYASQMDLDRAGNAIGVITARDAAGYPAVVELAAADQVGIRGKGPKITEYRIGGATYQPSEIWHERQYVVPGIPLGLSPIAHGAWSIGNFLSTQQFINDWFSGGGATMPSGHLKNTQKTISSTEATSIKGRFRASVESGDVFVSGEDWEFTPVSVTGQGAQFVEAMQFGVADLARFFGLPGDMIDAVTTKGTITYANVVQRNLQALVWYLQPIFERREAALSKALPKPRFAVFETDSILRMDPKTRAEVINSRVSARVLAPSEARALDNLPPFTPAQVQEFDDLGIVAALPTPVAVPGEGQ